MHPELDCGTSCNQVWVAKVSQDIDVFLTQIVITNDDISRHSNEIPECKCVSLKKPIFVDIYI